MDSNHQRIMIMRLVFFSIISVLLVIGYLMPEFIPRSFQDHVLGFVIFFLITWFMILGFVLYEKMR